MATTIIYLDAEDMKKLAAGDKVEIDMTNRMRSSDRIWIRVDQTKQEKE